jgi:hypothetical protein
VSKHMRLGRLLAAGSAIVLLMGLSTAAHATVYQFQNLGSDFLDGGKHTSTTDVYVKVGSQGIDKTQTAGVFNSVLVQDPGTASQQIIAVYSLCNDLKQSINWAPADDANFTAGAVVYVTSLAALPGSTDLSGTGVYTPSAVMRSEVAWLMDTYLDGALYEGSSDSAFTGATSQERATGLQAAVWKLWYGDTTNTVAPTDAEAATVMDNLLTAAAGHNSYTSTTAVWVYNSQYPGWYQDQLMVLSSPVPEPAFYQLTGLAGMVALGFRMRKRRV